MPHIDANGVRLHYRLDGPTEGPVLVLSHSVGTTLQMWRPQMEALKSRVRILRYDTRGHGSSSVPAGEYAVDDLGRDLVALLDHLELSRVSLCGLSLGGLVAMWMGIHAKDRLERLVLANTAAYLGPPENWQARIDLVREQGTAALAEVAPTRWFTEAFRRNRLEEVKSVVDTLLATDPVGYMGCCAAIRDVDFRPAIAGIVLPTLVIGGTYEPATPIEAARYLADHIRGAELVEIDASHLSNIERADAFNRALERFLDEKARLSRWG